MPKKKFVQRCRCNNCHKHRGSCTCRPSYMCNRHDCTECPSIVLPSDDDSNISGIMSTSMYEECVSETGVPPDHSLIKTPATTPATTPANTPANSDDEGELNEK